MTTEQYLGRSRLFRRLKRGPHGQLWDLYAARLAEDGLAGHGTWRCLNLADGLLNWIASGRRKLADLNERMVERYLRHLAKNLSIQPGDRAALKRLLSVMRDGGTIAPAAAAAIAPPDQIFEEFGEYPRKERGLTSRSIVRHLPVIRRFLREVCPAGASDLGGISQAAVIRYIECHAQDWSAGTGEAMCWSPRAFLRCLHHSGLNPLALDGCVPSIRRWKHASLRTWLSAAQVQKVLDGCDRATALGRRDYAILMMPARLGMRANEVATLTLDDIDWQSGEMLIRAKGRQRTRMPLLPDVGAAVVAYLRKERPASSCRRWFLRGPAPRAGFASGCAVTMIARTVLECRYPWLRTPGSPHLPAWSRYRTPAFRRSLVGDRPAAAAREPRHHAHLSEGGYRRTPDIEPAVAGRRAMTDPRTALERYLSMRQGLGYKYQHQARRLTDFVSFMEKRQARTITMKLAMAWATSPPDRHASWTLRLTDVRGFARHVSNIDPKTEVPPAGLLPRLKRARPYVYSDAEINALLAAALALPPAGGLRRRTYHYLFGMIAVTGMRLSEAIGLQRDDVDLTNGVLTIRRSKFARSRLVPLHSTTRAALGAHAMRRDTHLGSRRGPYFFVTERGGRLPHQYVHRVFRRLSREIGLRRQDDHSGPRVHDFRHRFAIQTLLNWYRDGVNVEQQLPVLSTYLGHTCVRDTYWYLSACPEVPREAARRLDQRWDVRP